MVSRIVEGLVDCYSKTVPRLDLKRAHNSRGDSIAREFCVTSSRLFAFAERCDSGLRVLPFVDILTSPFAPAFVAREGPPG
jgi:hypothetical protein